MHFYVAKLSQSAAITARSPYSYAVRGISMDSVI